MVNLSYVAANLSEWNGSLWKSVSQEKKKMVSLKKESEINVGRLQTVHRYQTLMLLGSCRGLCVHISIEHPIGGRQSVRCWWFRSEQAEKTQAQLERTQRKDHGRVLRPGECRCSADHEGITFLSFCLIGSLLTRQVSEKAFAKLPHRFPRPCKARVGAWVHAQGVVLLSILWWSRSGFFQAGLNYSYT